MVTFTCASTSSTACTTTRLSDIEAKVDRLIQMVGQLDGIRSFGSNVAANIVADMLMRR